MVAPQPGRYASWRLLRAALGHGPEGSDDAKERIPSGLASGIGYAALCVTAVKILAGSEGAVAGRTPTKQPAARWARRRHLVVMAMIIVGVGPGAGLQGPEKFLENSKTGEMSHRVRQGFTALGVAGRLARMVVFALIGYFFDQGRTRL